MKDLDKSKFIKHKCGCQLVYDGRWIYSEYCQEHLPNYAKKADKMIHLNEKRKKRNKFLAERAKRKK